MTRPGGVSDAALQAIFYGYRADRGKTDDSG
jgi:hypothetical protein